MTDFQRYVRSSLVTFFSAFATTILVFMENTTDYGWATTKAVLFSALLAGVRATLKFITENFIDKK